MQIPVLKYVKKTFHWLPIKARIEYKIALLSFNAQNSRSPSYLTEMITPYIPDRSLRSLDKHLLKVPKTNLKLFGDRSFSNVGPSVWNSLPQSLRQASSVATFKKHLKTHLFLKHLT